ncbi:MAG: hypothetical protein AAF570_15550, partial [Bacteroidota bacterium]
FDFASPPPNLNYTPQNNSCSNNQSGQIDDRAYITRGNLPTAENHLTLNDLLNGVQPGTVDPYYPCCSLPCGGDFDAQGVCIQQRSRWSFAGPLRYAQEDGKTQAAGIWHLFENAQQNGIALPQRIDYIAENGEEQPSCQDPTDPDQVNQMNQLNLPNYADYRGFRKHEFRMTYEHSVLSHVDRPFPQFSNIDPTNTPMNWFGLDGNSAMYPELRMINFDPNEQQVYPTPYIYPQIPANWFTTNWIFQGLEELTTSRGPELALGDNRFAPYVSPQINDRDECGGNSFLIADEESVRPGQWLGMLKLMGGLGAEFYHVFVANDPHLNNVCSEPNHPNQGFSFTNLQYPEWYIWQTSTPSYAQAITSRYENILRNGVPLVGDWNNFIAPLNQPRYLFWAGNDHTPVVVRQSTQDQDQYVITAAIETSVSPQIGENMPRTDIVTIDLGANTGAAVPMTFEARRQGSVYFYDASPAPAANGNPKDPIFYQLDRWHQVEHPERWEEDFYFEAEVFDDMDPSQNGNGDEFEIFTEQNSTTPGDFSNAVSYMGIESGNGFNCYSGSGPILKYNFQVKDLNSQSTLFAYVRARAKNSTDTGMELAMDFGTGNYQHEIIGCVNSANWEWYTFEVGTNTPISFTNLAAGMHELRVIPRNSALEIDQIILSTTANPTNMYTNQVITPVGANCIKPIA